MKSERLRAALHSMAAQPDVLGCALVSTEDGMLWHAEGAMTSLEVLASSSSDYWRLNHRTQGSFDGLGELRVLMLVHRHGQILVSECGARMLLVLVTAGMKGIDWERWKSEHTHLATLVNDM